MVKTSLKLRENPPEQQSDKNAPVSPNVHFVAREEWYIACSLVIDAPLGNIADGQDGSSSFLVVALRAEHFGGEKN